jgi:hypothetical protein
MFSPKEPEMKFMLSFSWKPDIKARDEAISRFRKTGGKPPAGAKLLGRWTRCDLNGGYDVLESDDPKALAEFAHMWSDLMELTIVPVLEDEGLNEVFARVA